MYIVGAHPVGAVAGRADVAAFGAGGRHPHQCGFWSFNCRHVTHQIIYCTFIKTTNGDYGSMGHQFRRDQLHASESDIESQQQEAYQRQPVNELLSINGYTMLVSAAGDSGPRELCCSNC
jgi:hypothetical protein